MLILALLSSGFVASHSFAQATLADFQEVDAYISTRMKDLGIPGAALVIVRNGQIVHLVAFARLD